MEIAKIAAGVEDCLVHCQDSTRQFKRLSSYIEALKANPDWSAEEIIELQTRVIRLLLQKQDGSAQK